jgi:hypothetical protein
MAVSDAAISNALLISTRDGSYPESEEILTTDIAASALQPSLRRIQEAKHRIEVRGFLQFLCSIPLTRCRADRYPRAQPK